MFGVLITAPELMTVLFSATYTEIEVETRVHWNEKNRMLKLAVPTPMTDAKYVGQVAYGINDLPMGGRAAVAQKWVAVTSRIRRSSASVPVAIITIPRIIMTSAIEITISTSVNPATRWDGRFRRTGTA